MRGLFLAFLGSLLLGCGDDLPNNHNDNFCPSSPLETSTARVFVIQPRIALGNFDTYAAYQEHLVELARNTVANCLAQDKPNIVVFPENTGLPAAFIGSRGQTARESTSAFAAFLALGGQYAQPIDFYKNKWPNVSLPNQIELGITDTVWRAFFETNQLIATELGAWVVASANVSGQVEKSTDPIEIATLADPDIPTSYVYVARDAAVYNTTYVHAPDGSIVASRQKPYLVATEQNDLALTPGLLRNALPVDIGPLRVGIFTSKDAWMPDMVDRLAVLGADTFVQTEAFSGWTIPENPSEPNVWAPDVLSQSAMAAVRKHGAYRHGVVSHLTGNLFDMTFDGQSIILSDPIPGQLAPGYVGQADEGGVLAVAPWVIPDPIVDDPLATIEVRRAKLQATGQELLPGGPRANEYVETAIGADIAMALPVTSDGTAGILGASRALSDLGQAEQSYPAVAWTNTSPIVVAFQEGARGATRIVVVTSEDQGKTFGTPHSVSNTKNSAQSTPTVTVSGIYVYVAWQERNFEGARIACALSKDRGKTFGSPAYMPVDLATADGWLPALASSNGQIYLSYTENIGGNERVVILKAAEGLLPFAGKLIEVVKPQVDGDVRNNQWSPSVAVNGNEVAVGWVDFRNENWDVFLSRSTDGGTTFAPPLRVDDGTDAPERLHDDPFLMFLPNVVPLTLAVGWSDVRQRNRYASARVSLLAGSVIGQSRKFGAADGSAVRPKLAPLGPSRFAVVWQDDRTLGNDVYMATSADGGVTFGAEQRLDDGGDGPSYQTAPVVAGDGQGSLLVAWEDSRSGKQRIRFVLGKP